MKRNETGAGGGVSMVLSRADRPAGGDGVAEDGRRALNLDEKVQLALCEALARLIAYEDKENMRDHYLQRTLPALRLLKKHAPEVWKRIEAEAKEWE